jgi:hypothetical protein
VNAKTMVKVHSVLWAVWLMLAALTTIWAIRDPENPYLLAWVIFMSGYANAGTHLAGRSGAAPSAKESD